MIDRRGGRWQDAMREYETALRLRERGGDLNGVAICHNNMAEVHRTRGELTQAIAAFQRAIEVWEGLGSTPFVAVALIGRGATRVQLGELAQGRADLCDAEVRLADVGSTLFLPDLHRELAVAALAAGELDEAERAVGRSLQYARRAGATDQIAMTQRAQAQVELARGNLAHARALLRASRRTLRAVGDVGELARTEAVLQTLGPSRRRRLPRPARQDARERSTGGPGRP
jgi:tetratricopeptide (TPR) repeat protein